MIYLPKIPTRKVALRIRSTLGQTIIVREDKTKVYTSYFSGH